MDTEEEQTVNNDHISGLLKMLVEAQQIQTDNLGKILTSAFEGFSQQIQTKFDASNAQIILQSGLPINVDNSTGEDRQGNNVNNVNNFTDDITSVTQSTSRALESDHLAETRKRKLPMDEDDDTVSLTTSENLDNWIDTMVQKPNEVDTDKIQEIWAEVNEEYEEEVDVGPEVMPALSSATKIMWLHKINEEKLKSKLEVKLPANCTFLDTKRVNKTIWQKASPIVRSKDIGMQTLQKKIAKSQVYLLKVAEAISNASLQGTAIDHTSLLKNIQHAIGLSGAANQNINDMRRQALKYALPKKLQPLAKSAPESDKLLFGDDLNKRVTDILASAKADEAFNKNSDAMKKDGSSNSNNWYAKDKVDIPYKGGYQSQNNYQRPNKGKYYQSYEYSKNEQPSSKRPTKRRRGRRQQGY